MNPMLFSGGKPPHNNARPLGGGSHLEPDGP